MSQKALEFILGFLGSLITDDGTRQAKGSWHFRKRLSKRISQGLFRVRGVPKIGCYWLIEARDTNVSCLLNAPNMNR